jgi:hypothetical protein
VTELEFIKARIKQFIWLLQQSDVACDSKLVKDLKNRIKVLRRKLNVR